MTAIDNTEIKFDRTTKDYAIYVDGRVIGYAPNYSAAEQKRTAYLAEQIEETGACAGFGCVDGCGDCQPTNETMTCPDCGDPSAGGVCHLCRDWDAPLSIPDQLAAKGMRLAHGEPGDFVNVRENGRITQVWACEQAATADDLDFSTDQPTVNAQLRKEGLRRARIWESGWYVTVIDMGRYTKVWATDATEPVTRAPLQFFSYAEAKMR